MIAQLFLPLFVEETHAQERDEKIKIFNFSSV